MSVKVSYHSKGGKHVGFKKMVGGRRVHLITGITEEHRRRAETVASALAKCWERVKAQGQQLSDEDIRAAFLSVRELPPGERSAQQRRHGSPAPVAAKGSAADAGDGSPLLHDCIERFKANSVKRFEGREISDDTLFQTLQLADKVMEGMPNVHINTLSKSDVDAMRQYWTRRPNRKGTDKPLAIATVKHLIRVTKAVLEYCIDEEGWKPSFRWEKPFKRLRLKNLMTLVEQKAAKGEKPKFTIDALQMLWHHCVPIEKVFLGLGLFAGHGSEEIATLLKADVVVEQDGVYIDRLRHKTGVYGRWWLPPEVSTLLLNEIAKTPENPQGLALLGRRGNPLVHRGDTGRKHKTDSVAQAWNRVRRRCKNYDVRLLPFKYLRKTGSQWVRDPLGKEFSQVFLAHERETVAEVSYNDPAFTTLAATMKRIHADNVRIFQKPDMAEWKHRQKARTPEAA